MQNVCKDSYYTTFGSYGQMLDYHRDQSANGNGARSTTLRCRLWTKVPPLWGNWDCLRREPARRLWMTR